MFPIKDNKKTGEHGRSRTDTKNKAPDLKSLIYYHRAYKKISNPGRHIFLKSLFIIPPLLIVIFLYPKLTIIMSYVAKNMLLFSFSFENIEVLEKSHMSSNIYMLNLPTKYPSPLFTYIVFLFSLLSIFLSRKIKIAKSIALWIIFLSFMNLISSIFFILAPSLFPYNTEEFSELYVKTEVNMWLFVPIITGLALLPLPSGILPKFIITLATLFYSVIFGIARYAAFLYIVGKFSLLFMPILFFAFGPLMDFFYIVSIYSIYVSILSEKARRDIKAWNWSY